jgi:hypothetical protein
MAQMRCAIAFSSLARQRRIMGSKIGTVMNERQRLMPVLGSLGACVGHLMLTAKGWCAFDREDRRVGVFDSADIAANALFGLAGSST